LTAVAAGASHATRALLAAGASVDVLDMMTGGNAAHVAARSPDPECAALVIRACATMYAGKRPVGLDARDRDGRTPLEVATRRVAPRREENIGGTDPRPADGGVYRVVLSLLDAGASPNSNFANGASPLAAAVAAGARDLCELLLERAADPDRGGFFPGTKRMLASPALVSIRASRRDLLELLVDQGADIDAPAACSSRAFAPSANAAVANDAVDGGRWTEEDPVAKPSSGEKEENEAFPTETLSEASTATPLQLACSLGELSCVSTLLRARAETSEPSSMPPAVCAAAAGRHEVLALMLELGAADPWTCDERGGTALHYAAARGHLASVRVLIAALAEIQADEDEERKRRGREGTLADDDDDTAAAAADDDSVKQKRRNVSEPKETIGTFDPAGFVGSLIASLRLPVGTAPSIRAGSSSTSPAKGKPGARPIGAGSDTGRARQGRRRLIDARDVDGQTALYAACAEGRIEIVRLLIDAGADFSERFAPNEASLLHVASAFDRPDLVRYLVAEAFKNPDPVDGLGRTPLAAAAAARATMAAEALLELGADPDGKPSRGLGACDSEASRGAVSRTSPILLASMNGNYLLCQELARRGCDVREAEARGVPFEPTPRAFLERGSLGGHANRVVAVRFHPSDPAIVATCGGDGAMRVYRRSAAANPDDDDQEESRWIMGVSYRCHAVASGGCTSVAWSHGGDRLVTSGRDGRCCVWKLPKTQKAPTATAQFDDAVFHVAWSPDDSRIVAAGGHALSVCDANTGKRLRTCLSGRGGGASGGAALTTAVGSAQMDDDLTRCAHARFRGFVAAAGFSAGESHVVSLWDPETGTRTAWVSTGAAAPGDPGGFPGVPGRPKRRLEGGCALDSDDGRLVTCDAEGWVRVWDTRLMGTGSSLAGGFSGSNNADVSGNTRRGFGAVMRWRAPETRGVADCVFSPDGTVVATASADAACALWDVRRLDGARQTCSGMGSGSGSPNLIGELRVGQNVGFGCCAFAGNGASFAAGTRIPPEELLYSRGSHVAIIWEGA